MNRPPLQRFCLSATRPSGATLLLACSLLFTATGMAVAKVASENLVWPPPPNPARLRYVQSITGPADLGIRRSFWGRAYGALTGQSQRFVLGRPLGLAVDDDGNLLLTDAVSKTVIWLDRTRNTVRQWNKLGSFRLASPVAVARSQSNFFVADSELPAVLCFTAKGELRFALTNDLQRPTGLAVTGNKLFIADTAAHCISVYDLNGQQLERIGQRGSGPGEFNFPTHIAVGPEGQLLVTDSMNSRVQVLDASGKFIAALGGAGTGPGYFSRPKGVAADGFGHVYVADAMSDNVQVYDLEGGLLMCFGQAGQQPGEFWMPGGIAISRDNRVYVADTYNQRIQVFQYLAPP